MSLISLLSCSVCGQIHIHRTASRKQRYREFSLIPLRQVSRRSRSESVIRAVFVTQNCKASVGRWIQCGSAAKTAILAVIKQKYRVEHRGGGCDKLSCVAAPTGGAGVATRYRNGETAWLV